MNFIKTFLAAILAFVVGSFLVFFLWILIIQGIYGKVAKTMRRHEATILTFNI